MLEKLQMHLQRLAQRKLIVFALAVTLILGSLFLERYTEAEDLKDYTHDAALLNVNTIAARATSKEEHIALPGSLLAWHEAAVFARAKGYLKAWYVDIGYKVKQGDVLAVIERPELDAQLKEAEDYLKVILARNNLAQITAHRWGRLVKTDSVSKQANDDKNYQAQALEAEVRQARANVEKLRAYVSFEKVIAPFTGTISLRQTDVGDLINIGSQPSEAKPLFRIVQTNPLRLYVNIPQSYATRIQPEMKVRLYFVEYPGQIFEGKLLKTAGAINPQTLTLQAEFEVKNDQNVLIPGSYTMVDFSIPSFPNSVILPVNTLIFRAEGLQVAVVGSDNRINLRNIQVGLDFGKFVQVNSGVKPGERVIINPLDAMYQGQLVRSEQLQKRHIS